MIAGLYTAANGMLALEQRQEILSNNIANASTPGFKSHAATQLGFNQVFSKALQESFHFDHAAAPAGGVKVVESYTNLAQGMHQKTNNPLNLALQGPGYFVVDTPMGERYTRNGNFTLNTEGDLVTLEGHTVQGASGAPLRLSGGTPNIAKDGAATVDGMPVGRLRLVEFEQPERLLRQGDNLYAASEEVAKQMQESLTTSALQGNLEMSNINLAREMVNMMLVSRTYNSNQKVIQGVDSTLGQLIQQVGMPG